MSGGTDNHMLLVDVASRGVTGKVAEKALDRAGITINKNKIPFDTRPPLDPSGIRIGTPALTTRGMRELEMRTIAGWIGEVLAAADDTAVAQRGRARCASWGSSFRRRRMWGDWFQACFLIVFDRMEECFSHAFQLPALVGTTPGKALKKEKPCPKPIIARVI